MRAMLNLLASMPLWMLVRLAIMLRRRPARMETTFERVQRARAINVLLDDLPNPVTCAMSRFELMNYQAVLGWLNAEIDAIQKLQQINVLLVGMVPMLHSESVPKERLS